MEGPVRNTFVAWARKGNCSRVDHCILIIRIRETVSEHLVEDAFVTINAVHFHESVLTVRPIRNVTEV